MNFKAIGFAVLATCFVGCGSFVAIGAPGDGQTGMITYPSWLLGLVFAIFCFASGGLKKPNIGPTLFLGFLAVASVVMTFQACYDYEKKWEVTHHDTNSP